MLQKAFFKVDVVDRIYDTLVFEKTTPGAYEFTVPEEYNYVVIEYAGAGGGKSQNPKNAAPAGNGAILTKGRIKTFGSAFFGIVASTTTSDIGGTGYHNGGTGRTNDGNKSGGGGGSTSVQYNTTVLEASGGAGQAVWAATIGGVEVYATGGKGGGPYGGGSNYGTTGAVVNNDATDPNQIGLNSGNGYVKIWAGYDPYFKG